jgi:DNA mismatch repair protein MutL
MGKIKILPETLSTKIAAGEVVERPASVIKELVENSIDAGATEISVTVEEGGKRLIRVLDNGCGLSRDDAELAVFRHATSKVATEKDLYRISTMGFRGEALPSIASVARLTLRTKPRGELVGTRVTVEGGAEPEVADEGCPEGTTVEVRDLFFNTPARGKFLRTATTEWGRILDVFKRTAIARPAIRFSIVHGGSGRPIEKRAGGLKEGVADVFGRSILKELLEVSVSIDASTSVTGLVGNPALSYPTVKWLYTYVNGRWVRDRGINRAIADAYSGTIEAGRYPFAIINLKVHFDEVDVNVHPAKTEVRFRRPSFAFDMVKAAVREAIGAGSLSFGKGPTASVPEDALTGETTPEAGAPQRAFKEARRRPAFNAREVQPSYSQGPPQAGLGLEPEEKREKREEKKVLNPEFTSMEMVGQIWGEFIVAQSPAGREFYLIDQHGASERTRFERLKDQFYNRSRVSSQYLLVPERLETTPEETAVIKDATEVLARLGFEVIPFGPSLKKGGESFLIKAAPDILEGRGLARLIGDLLEELTELNRSSRIEEKIEEVLMTLACHSVIRGPRTLTKEEARALFSELSRCNLVGHCPHGRPVVKRFAREEIEAMFKRR